MTFHFFTTRVITGLALVAGLILLAPAVALAEDAPASGTPARESAESPRKTRKQELAERKKYAVGERAGKAFETAKEHLAAERYAEAEAALGKLKLRRLTPHERAQTHRLFGYSAYGRQDNAAALEHLTLALAEDALPPADRSDVLFQVAQIQAVEGRWPDVIATLETWFQQVERPNSVGYYLMAVAYYQQGDVDAALLPAKKAVQIAKKPQQAWLQLLLALHLTKRDYAAAAPVLVDLISHHPNVDKGYWLQLYAVYGVLEEHRRALGVLELAHRKGLLTDDADLRRLVELTLFMEIPHRAARILEEGLAANRIEEDAEALELLSTSWIMAREAPKAEAALARAAELSPQGNLYVRLAQVHLVQEEWTLAAEALRKALDKGGLDDPGNAQLLLGITYYSDHKLHEARSWFARAQQSGATREQARSWLEHIDREIQAGRSDAEAAG
jgi:tetratricopeptide (TPR) repeat protein